MKKGFTLIELLVVVLIIGILAAVALPQYQQAVDKARYAELMSLVSTLAKAEEIYFMANGQYTDDFSELDISLPLERRVEGSSTDYVVGKNYYISCDFSHTTSQYVYGKYMDAQVLYLIYLDHSSTPGKRQCRSHRENAERGEKICRSLGGVYAGVGPYNGKIFDLP